MRPLFGARYVRPGNQQLVEIIQSELFTWDYEDTWEFYKRFTEADPDPQDHALLGCNDRYYLLTVLCHRRDAFHPWLFERCREVEVDPDDHLDLWARYHYKSTIITFAGSIQEVVRDPETRIAIFSFNKKVASKFLGQIKEEFESNDALKVCYPDVLWWEPSKESPQWSVADGIVVKRRGNPKEATIEAHGLIEALPTGSHFPIHIYDDMITERQVTHPEMIAKVTERWELADNLGHELGTRKWHIGTRYHLGDTYKQLMERDAVKPRVYPATHNGKANGKPVLLTQKRWEEVKRAQKRTLAAQMLQNPLADDTIFNQANFRRYLLRPIHMNVYIMGDPSKGRSATSDRTAIAVVGIDTAGNKYLLDGYRHRMNQEQRWDALYNLYVKWADAPGVQMIKVGWEQYGMAVDDEYFERQMRKKKYRQFIVHELNWVREGNQSKTDRVERLQPDIDNSEFWFPPLVWNNNVAPRCQWKPSEDGSEIQYRAIPTGRDLKEFEHARKIGEPWRIIEPIIRKDEDGHIYDLTRVLWEELIFFPFSPKDDICDAVSRIYDLEPREATHYEAEDYETEHAWDA